MLKKPSHRQNREFIKPRFPSSQLDTKCINLMLYETETVCESIELRFLGGNSSTVPPPCKLPEKNAQKRLQKRTDCCSKVPQLSDKAVKRTRKTSVRGVDEELTTAKTVMTAPDCTNAATRDQLAQFSWLRDQPGAVILSIYCTV